MPECKKCGNSFPNKKMIDGKYRFLSHRTYCLDCSPFNSHNTRKIHIENPNDTDRICKICGKTYHYYSEHSKRNGQTLNKCSSCMVGNRRFEMKRRLVEYKGGKCEYCGYNKNIKALCFHHLEPDKKKFNFSSSLHAFKWETLKEESDKCILLCTNCHIELHDEELDGAAKKRRDYSLS